MILKTFPSKKFKLQTRSAACLQVWLNPLIPRAIAKNVNLKPLMPFFDCCGGKLQETAQNIVCNMKTKLPFHLGSNKLIVFD